MKKIIVIGCPGSGKSHFSTLLHKKTGIPLYHLDMLYWNADKTTVEKELFLERMSRIMENDEWIIDGNYSSTMEYRLSACDTVFFLDYPLEVCLSGIEQRRGKQRADIPWIETESDEEFIEYIKTFSDTQRPKIINLFEKYKNKNIIIFKNREEAICFLKEENM